MPLLWRSRLNEWVVSLSICTISFFPPRSLRTAPAQEITKSLRSTMGPSGSAALSAAFSAASSEGRVRCPSIMRPTRANVSRQPSPTRLAMPATSGLGTTGTVCERQASMSVQVKLEGGGGRRGEVEEWTDRLPAPSMPTM